MNSKNNIQFNYLYRDGGNFKVFDCQIFSNPENLSIESIESKIRAALISGEFFEPEDWNIKRLKFDDWIPKLDHIWNEFESIELTNRKPTMECSISEFLKRLPKKHSEIELQI